MRVMPSGCSNHFNDLRDRRCASRSAMDATSSPSRRTRAERAALSGVDSRARSTSSVAASSRSSAATVAVGAPSPRVIAAAEATDRDPSATADVTGASHGDPVSIATPTAVRALASVTTHPGETLDRGFRCCCAEAGGQPLMSEGTIGAPRDLARDRGIDRIHPTPGRTCLTLHLDQGIIRERAQALDRRQHHHRGVAGWTSELRRVGGWCDWIFHSERGGRVSGGRRGEGKRCGEGSGGRKRDARGRGGNGRGGRNRRARGRAGDGRDGHNRGAEEKGRRRVDRLESKRHEARR